jgi:serine/threonine protein kinase
MVAHQVPTDRPMPDASSARLSVGELLAPGRRLLQRLGGGDRYEAFVAWDDHLHAMVVVKVLRPRLADDERARAAFEREADALEALQHPDLVRGFGAVRVGPRPHLVLEFLDGPRLSTLIRKFGPLSPEQTVLLGRRLASVLAYLANAGWVHLDVKPRNIVMTATPRLIDLSVARPVSDARGRTGIGTAAYMAPEQADPARADEIGPPSDVWGLGATLYEAVAARQAFPRTPDGPRYPQLSSRPEPMPERVPLPLAAAIERCLEDRPEARPAAAELHDLLEPLADWAERSSRRVRGVR